MYGTVSYMRANTDRFNEHVSKHLGRSVLVIGNGFDLAHGLLTSYDDFLKIMKAPDDFIKYYNSMIGEPTMGIYDSNNPWVDYLNYVTKGDEDDIRKMIKILKNNSWAHYYANCNADIEGWIDFEQEMKPVIKMFSAIVSRDNQYFKDESSDCAKVFLENAEMGRIAQIWPKFIRGINYGERDSRRIYVTIDKAYSDKNYGVITKRIIGDLWDELKEFIDAFAFYLSAVAENKEIQPISLFENMIVSDIVNFNYTYTPYKYHASLRNATIHFVHGSTLNKNSEKMILGVNSVDKEAEYRFKEYEKRYQRICNNTKQSYNQIINEGNYELIVYGHSLDITDKSILEPLIRNSRKCTIYCHTKDNGESDRNTKIKNLMLMLGDEVAEKMMNNEEILLKP